MKILKNIGIVLFAFLVLTLTACDGTELPDGMNADELMAAGQNVVLLLVEEEYEALYELLREDQRGSVTVDKIRSIVSDELDGAGYYKQIEKRMVTGTKEKGVHYGVAMFYCEFSEKDVLIRVCFDAQLQLVGFSLMRD